MAHIDSCFYLRRAYLSNVEKGAGGAAVLCSNLLPPPHLKSLVIVSMIWNLLATVLLVFGRIKRRWAGFLTARSMS